jgi:hypothetical protein
MGGPPLPNSRFSIIVLVGLLIALSFMSADIIVLALRPLTYLGVRFWPALRYTPILASVTAFVIWLVLRRWRSNLAAIIGLVVSIAMISGVASWADHQIAKVKIKTWINSNDFPSLEARVGFKVWETGDASGNQVWVTKVSDHTAAITAEMKRLGNLRQ